MSKSDFVSAEAVRPAATVVLLRDSPSGPELFMVRRHEGTAFMGGAHVFPGGRVDAGDYESLDETWCDGLAEAASRMPDLAPTEAAAYHAAAARELFEEAGVLLARNQDGLYISLTAAASRARFKQYRHHVHARTRRLRDIVAGESLRLALTALVPFAHWVTPPVDVRRFDTRFFVARVPADQVPVHDDLETTASTWMTAADALARCRRDEIFLPPPTWTTLREIERFRSVAEITTWALTCPVSRREPRFIEQNNRKMLLLAGDPLHPERPAEPPAYETRFILINGRWRAEAM